MRALDRDDSEIVRRGLVAIADRLSEAFANSVDENGNIEDERQLQRLLDINREVWRLRWEICLLGGADAETLETEGGAP